MANEDPTIPIGLAARTVVDLQALWRSHGILYSVARTPNGCWAVVDSEESSKVILPVPSESEACQQAALWVHGFGAGHAIGYIQGAACPPY